MNIDKFAERAATLLTAGLVASFYIVFLATMFFGFTGHVSRVTLSKDLAQGTGSLDTVIYLATREGELQRDIDVTRATIAPLQSEFSAARGATAKFSNEYYSQLQQLVVQFAPLMTSIASNASLLEADYISKFRDAYSAEAPTASEAPDRIVYSLPFELRKADMLAGIFSVPEFRPDVTDEVRKRLIDQNGIALAALYEQRAAVEKARSEWSVALDTEDELNDELNRRHDAIAALEKQRDALGLTDTNRAVIASYESLGGLPYFALKIPTIILTLIVTVAAGGLGSTVAFTRKVASKATPPGGALPLLINVGEGVAAAVAIFLLAGSGMLMLTQGVEGTDRNVELSPYLVACIAFISGFMAEDAFHRIRTAGTNLFRGNVPPNDPLQ